MVYTVESLQAEGLNFYDLGSDTDLDAINEFDNVQGSSTRAAVCSGVAKQFADGQNIEEIIECYSDFEEYIEQTYEYLKEEEKLDDPDIEVVFYETMLDIVEEALLG